MSCRVIYTLNLTCVGPYPGKKAKLFEHAKGLPPDVAESDSMGDRSSTSENEIPIKYSVSTASSFVYYLSPDVDRMHGIERKSIATSQGTLAPEHRRYMTGLYLKPTKL